MRTRRHSRLQSLQELRRPERRRLFEIQRERDEHAGALN